MDVKDVQAGFVTNGLSLPEILCPEFISTKSYLKQPIIQGMNNLMWVMKSSALILSS